MLESVYGLGGVFAAQRWRWLDRPSAVADASYKPHQLTVAAECGLNVPASLVTNDGAQARKFAAEVDGELIYKSLSTGVLTEQDELRIIYTTLLTDDDLDKRHDRSIALRLIHVAIRKKCSAITADMVSAKVLSGRR